MRHYKKIGWVVIILAAAMIAAALGIWHFDRSAGDHDRLPASRLQACGSFPIGTATTVPQTSRLFVNIPSDIYSDINLQVAASGATANYVSNGGPYGYALGAQGKSDCWSYYFEFEGSGTVVFSSKSAIPAIPDYVLSVQVAGMVPAPATTSPAAPPDGTVLGQVLLGPTCPVERNPPDPACAPRPYAATFGISKNLEIPRAFMTVLSSASGTFRVALPAGEYLFYPEATAVYPRCSQTLVEVAAGKSSSIVINCDTGIR